MGGKRAAVGLVAAVAAVAGGYAAGHSSASGLTWHEGWAYLGGDERLPQFSVAADDWTYGAQGVVPEWIDAQGTPHTREWPACMQPPPPEDVTSSRTRHVRFASLDDIPEGVHERLVVVVDCRS